MLSKNILIGAVSLFSLASALPGWDDWACPSDSSKDKCLTRELGEKAAAMYLELVGETATGKFDTALAESMICDDFIDTSDSINYLAGLPLGGTTFGSKKELIAGAGSQLPQKFDLIEVDAVTCDGVVAFRWTTLPGSGKYASKGINVIYLKNAGDVTKVGTGGWQVSEVYAEFNNAAWIVDIGGTCPAPPPPSKLMFA